MPKNSNFFKKQKEAQAKEIEIFTSGDPNQIDYQEDMRKHHEAEAKISKAKDDDFGIEIYEGRKPEKEISKNQEKSGNEYRREERKDRNDNKNKNNPKSQNTKDPEDVPVQIFVKGNPPKEESYREEEVQNRRQPISEKLNPNLGYQTEERAEMSEDIEIKGQEYEMSMNLLKKHQEMMKSGANTSDKNPTPSYEFIGREDNVRQSNSQRQTYIPPQQNRRNTYQRAPVVNYQQQQYPSQSEIQLQNKIELFTQQMTASMANLQNFVRNEMTGVKQRLSYLESKVESLARRQNELELDRLNQDNMKRNIEVQNIIPPPTPPLIDPVSVPSFENKDFMLNQSYPSDKNLDSLEIDDEWSKVVSMVQKDEINMAYSHVLQKNDEMLLFKLMGRTGVCLDRLDSENIENVINSVINTLKSKAFIDLLLPWAGEYCSNNFKLPPAAKTPYIKHGLSD